MRFSQQGIRGGFVFIYERNSSESSDEESFLAPADEVVNNFLSPVVKVGVGETDVFLVIGDVGMTDTSILVCFFIE